MTLVLRYLVLVLSLGAQQTTADADLDQLFTLHEQAALAQNAGDYEEAERLHRMVVDTMRKIPDFPLFQQARMYSNLASVLNLRGRADEALPLLHRAQDLLEQDPPRDFTQASTLHFNLGRAYALTGQLTEAEDEHKQGMEILNANGARGILLADAEAKLAYIYWKTNRIEDAKMLYQRTISFFRLIVGSDHPFLRLLESEYEELLRTAPG